MIEYLGKYFKRRDDTGFLNNGVPSVFVIEQSKKKNILIARIINRKQSAHGTFSIKEVEKKIKKGYWIEVKNPNEEQTAS